MKKITVRCEFCDRQYEARMVNKQRLIWILENLRCPHCGKARTKQGDVPGKRCIACNMPESLLPSFKSKKRPPQKLIKGLCAADYVSERRMNKGMSEQHNAVNEAQ